MSAFTETKPANFFDLLSIAVVLTYNFIDPPVSITFPTTIIMDADAIAARQAFYTKPDGDQTAGAHAYNVDMLARLIAGKPEGLPGFDDHLNGTFGENAPIESIREALKGFLSEPSPMKQKVAREACDQYARITQPVEFFR